ncbi:MAG TPA: hypothetical protein PLK35_03790 [Candidatus Moranbacteria bacterium]|nr:hypothetical protein [Candidatus Moranbacteria bacterium]
MKKNIEEIPFLDFFKSAWKITKENRFLWWLGFMVALASGGSTNINLPFDSNGKEAESAKKIGEFLTQNIELVIAGVIFIFVLYLVFISISTLGRGALIKSIDHIIKKEPTGLKPSLREGKSCFWRVLILGIILIFLIILSLIVIITPIIFLFATKSYVLGVILSIFAFLIMIPLFILVSYLKTFGYIYIVLGKLSVGSAIESAYNLFRQNLLSSIIMGLFFFPIGILMFFIILLIVIPLLFIFVPLGFLAYFLGGNVPVGIIIALGILIFIILAFFIRSLFEVFSQAAWLLFFREIATPKVEEKITEVLEELEKADTLPAGDPIKTIETEK